MAQRFQVPTGMPVQPLQPNRSPHRNRPVPKGADFSRILEQELTKTSLKFSAHAEKRLESRNISLTTQQITSLEKAVDKLSAKGAKESLILSGNVAFVVSVPNRTVITAIDGDGLKENVFTNIDSAVIT